MVVQDTPGLDFNPGDQDDGTEYHMMNEQAQFQSANGIDAPYNDNVQNEAVEEDQQDQLFGTGIKEDG